MRIISLHEYDAQWSSQYEDELEDIKNIISHIFISSHHIGSTAVKNIMAKPIIDMLIEVSDISKIDRLLHNFDRLGYISKGEYGITGRRFFYKGVDFRTHHLHIFEQGHPDIQRHCLFVEFLNTHLSKAKAYEALKIELAKKYHLSPKKYSEGKSEFIRALELEAIEWKRRQQN